MALNLISWSMIDSPVPVLNGGRLALASGTPVPLAAVESGTIYYTQDTDNAITLWDGYRSRIMSFTEPSVAVPSVAAGNVGIIYAYKNGSSVSLEASTAIDTLARRNGFLVKASDHTRRALGAYYTTGTGSVGFIPLSQSGTGATGYVNGSFIGLTNLFNRRSLTVRSVITTDTWSYATATWRQMAALTGCLCTMPSAFAGANQVSAIAMGRGNTDNQYSDFKIGIGLNSTTVNHSLTSTGESFGNDGSRSDAAQMRALLSVPSLSGANTFCPLEISWNGSSVAFRGGSLNGTGIQLTADV